MAIRMTSSNARWPKIDDAIFATLSRVRDAKEKLGKDNIIDSTVGCLYDENEELVTFDSVYNEFHSMENNIIASYAMVSGDKDFQENVIDVCFGDYKPEAYIRSVSTVGGLGAVRHGIWSYASVNDYVICPDWYWKAYETMCEEFDRKFVTFKLFNDDYKFNFDSFKDVLNKCLEETDRVVVLLNSPANNPTGYSISDEEWDYILNFLKEISEDNKKRITILLDVAYIEYAGNGEQKRFFKKFSNLPKNLFIMIAYSMSKAYTVYGMRSGAAIGISSSKEIADEFYYSLSHANRANWSNGNHGAMQLLVELNKDLLKKSQYLEELNNYKRLLKVRADEFIKECKKINLETIPYFGGFFISIPCENPELIAKELEKRNLYIIYNNKGLRFAVCSVSINKCKLAPNIIKGVLDAYDNSII